MTTRVTALVALVGALLLAGCESPIRTPYAPVASFEHAAYCAAPGATEQFAITEDASADEILHKAAVEVARASADEVSCVQAFEDGENLFQRVLSNQRNALATAGSYRASDDVQIADVQFQITRLWREDQSARGAYVGLATKQTSGPAFWAQRLATAHATRVDAEATAYMEALLEKIDWVDRERYGSSVSAHAWLLVQHADDHPTLQTLALQRMRPYFESGGIKAANYAYLWDRVAVNAGRLQRYGTQPKWECVDGALELQPLEEPETLDQRRAELGMPPVEQDLARMASSVCP